MERPPFLFIVGCGRSGTTLLRAIFDSHPDIAIPPETHFIAWMGMRRRRYRRGAGIDIGLFLSDVDRRGGFRELRMTAEEVRRTLERSGPQTFADGVRSLYARYAEREGKTRYGDKTPVHVLAMPLLARLFPEAAFVHIIRDGRDVALSYLDQEFGPTTIEEGALRWRRMLARGRPDGARLEPSRYREVRYERLIAEPEATIRDLCAFIDLPFDDSMLRYFDRAREVLEGITNPEAQERLMQPPTRGLRDWRHQMPSEQVFVFEALAGNLLSGLGYERAWPRIPLRSRIEVWSRAAMGSPGGLVRSELARLARGRRSAPATARRPT